jgi:thiamine-phosphate pyrophosphorylase
VLSIPVFGIGGVTSSRAQDVRRVGGYGVAVISGILSAQFVEASTRAFVRALAGP